MAQVVSVSFLGPTTCIFSILLLSTPGQVSAGCESHECREVDGKLEEVGEDLACHLGLLLGDLGSQKQLSKAMGSLAKLL